MKKLRIWWIPQVPMEAFRADVDSIEEAKKILNILANYDLFQLEHKIKPDYSNTGGLECSDGKEWLEFEDEEGNDIWHTSSLDSY